MYVAINKSEKQKSISGSIVYGGDSRLIPDDQVHEALAKGFEVPNYATEPTTPIDAPPLPQELSTAELVDMTLKEIDDLMSELTDPQILALESAEKSSDSPRSGLFKMIEYEMSERAPKK